MRGADQTPAIEQEPPRRPVQAPAGVRADIGVGVCDAIDATQDQARRIGTDNGIESAHFTFAQPIGSFS